MGLCDLINGDEQPFSSGSRRGAMEAPCMRHGCENMIPTTFSGYNDTTPRFCSPECRQFECPTCDEGVSMIIGQPCAACAAETRRENEQRRKDEMAKWCDRCEGQGEIRDEKNTDAELVGDPPQYEDRTLMIDCPDCKGTGLK